jgi:hypothetical protein
MTVIFGLDAWTLNACSWIFVSIVFFGILAWVIQLRSAVRKFVCPIEAVAVKLCSIGSEESAEDYAMRLKRMSDDDLVREIQAVRKSNEMGREIAEAIAGLWASVPFLGRR